MQVNHPAQTNMVELFAVILYSIRKYLIPFVSKVFYLQVLLGSTRCPLTYVNDASGTGQVLQQSKVQYSTVQYSIVYRITFRGNGGRGKLLLLQTHSSICHGYRCCRKETNCQFVVVPLDREQDFDILGIIYIILH